MAGRPLRRARELAHVQNPIPELVKGSRTPYRMYTRDWEFLTPFDRKWAFMQRLAKTADTYSNNIECFHALGSGMHWLGVFVLQKTELNESNLWNVAITLQSGKSWSVVENKVIRWFSQPDSAKKQYSDTGSGSLEFMRWAAQALKEKITLFRQLHLKLPDHKADRIRVGWGDAQRERAYAWLKRLGFQRVEDSGEGKPGYILDFPRQAKTNPYKAAIPVVSGIAYQRNPVDLKGRYIPDRYLAGLPPKLRSQRIEELTLSRDAYRQGDFSELPTDRTARQIGLVKESQYTTEAKKRGVEYRGDLREMAERVLRVYSGQAAARDVSALAEALRQSFAKGLAAWKSGGHRPGATAQNWAVARVNSLVVGGKTSWTADKKQFSVLPAEVKVKIEARRQTLQHNPRRHLRADTRFFLDSGIQEHESANLPTPGGTFWSVVTFFSPEIDQDSREIIQKELYNREKYKFYAQAALGGVWAWWPDQAEWEAKEPGRVEFIAAGSGFGPDILEAAANVFQRPLVLGEGWDPAIELFGRYGGTVRPTKETQFSPVQRADARTGPGQNAVRSAACDAFNEVSLDAGILPRYQAANDRYSEDAQKLSADAAINK